MAQLIDNWTQKRHAFSADSVADLNCPWALWPLTLDPSACSVFGWAQNCSASVGCEAGRSSGSGVPHRSREPVSQLPGQSSTDLQISPEISPFREVKMSGGEEGRRESFLTCCWLLQSWSCSCCCSFSFWSLRRSISPTFSLNWQASSWCLLTLCFKCLTSPSSAATWARRKRKSRKLKRMEME